MPGQAVPSYSYLVTFSAMDQEYVATCVEISGLSGMGQTEGQAIDELKEAVAGWIDYLQERSLPLPASGVGAGVIVSVDGDVELTNVQQSAGNQSVSSPANMAPTASFPLVQWEELSAAVTARA